MKIIIPGEPIPKARPRFFVKGGKKLAYNSQSGKESEIAWYMKKAYQECEIRPSGDSYEIDFRFYFRPPPGKDANLKLWGIIPHSSRPDLDNICKMYMDAANGVLYPDDAMVTRLSSSKHYSTNPRTEIDIMAKKIEKPEGDHLKIIKSFSPDEFEDFIREAGRLFTAYGRVTESESQQMIMVFAKKYAKKLSEIAK